MEKIIFSLTGIFSHVTKLETLKTFFCQLVYFINIIIIIILTTDYYVLQIGILVKHILS